jgi:hypothetical protein
LQPGYLATRNVRSLYYSIWKRIQLRSGFRFLPLTAVSKLHSLNRDDHERGFLLARPHLIANPFDLAHPDRDLPALSPVEIDNDAASICNLFVGIRLHYDLQMHRDSRIRSIVTQDHRFKSVIFRRFHRSQDYRGFDVCA